MKRDRTIGMVGGGQLGRMLCAAAGRLGFETIVLEPDKNAPAAQFANQHIIAGYDDQTALKMLSDHCSVITYEFENIPVSSVEFLSNGSLVYPPKKALEISQDRLLEKQFINELGVGTAEFRQVCNMVELGEALQEIGPSTVLKTRRMGYDGKGQIRISASQLDELRDSVESVLQVECLLESMVDFSCEISVIGARDKAGKCQCYDASQNTHANGILVVSKTPENIADTILEKAQEITVSILNGLKYVGVIGVEFFVEKNGNLLVNEFAPRVHNSGHWTEAACTISQFEQHIRAITGLELGNPECHSDYEMNNLIGEDILQVENLAQQKNMLINVYGKQEIRAGRKMGHVTRIFPGRSPK